MDTNYLNTDMCKCVSPQSNESRTYSADSSKACCKHRVCSRMLWKQNFFSVCLCEFLSGNWCWLHILMQPSLWINFVYWVSMVSKYEKHLVIKKVVFRRTKK